MPAPMPVSLHQLRVRTHVALGALLRGFRAAVRWVSGVLVPTLDPSDRSVSFEGGFVLGVRDLGGGSLFEGCGFGLLEFLFGGFEGLFVGCLLGNGGACGIGAGGVALGHGGCWDGVVVMAVVLGVGGVVGW